MFLENMCALSVSLHFLRALSLESESAHKKCKDRERARIFISVYICIFLGPYYISHIIWLIFVQDLWPHMIYRLAPHNRSHLHE